MSQMYRKLLGGIIAVSLLVLIAACNSSEEGTTDNQSDQDTPDVELDGA
ncbi:hypothetical protein [Bacillus sp. JCM 19034]|nr:hypothetical protein [Bacillus sp. JCM 19034]